MRSGYWVSTSWNSPTLPTIASRYKARTDRCCSAIRYGIEIGISSKSSRMHLTQEGFHVAKPIFMKHLTGRACRWSGVKALTRRKSAVCHEEVFFFLMYWCRFMKSVTWTLDQGRIYIRVYILDPHTRVLYRGKRLLVRWAESEEFVWLISFPCTRVPYIHGPLYIAGDRPAAAPCTRSISSSLCILIYLLRMFTRSTGGHISWAIDHEGKYRYHDQLGLRTFHMITWGKYWSEVVGLNPDFLSMLLSLIWLINRALINRIALLLAMQHSWNPAPVAIYEMVWLSSIVDDLPEECILTSNCTWLLYVPGVQEWTQNILEFINWAETCNGSCLVYRYEAIPLARCLWVWGFGCNIIGSYLEGQKSSWSIKIPPQNYYLGAKNIG